MQKQTRTSAESVRQTESKATALNIINMPLRRKVDP
jgi:hypothetical protein